MKRWENNHRDGTRWWIEIESDMFEYENEGMIVSLWAENTDSEAPADEAETTLIMATADEAREMAAHLLLCAEHVEKWHAEHPIPRTLTA